MSEQEPFKFEISLSVLNHLGRGLYRNFITVLGEAISNSWDADANNVWIHIDRNQDYFFIVDDGKGMNADDFQNRFLTIGYSKRKDPEIAPGKRPFIGAKGIGKLALLSCADHITVFSKTQGMSEYIGGRVENAGLDKAIEEELQPSEYPLEDIDMDLLDDVEGNIETLPDCGTIVYFNGLGDKLKTSTDQLRKLLALSFQFALIDPNFSIHVDGKKIDVQDLKFLADRTQFLWAIDGYSDSFIESMSNLRSKETSIPSNENGHFPLSSNIGIKGYIASVEKPSNLNVRGMKEDGSEDKEKGRKITIDLFVNGRVRELNLLDKTTKHRIAESYLYGQIHFDAMDKPENQDDPFTSSREGVIADNLMFNDILDELGDTMIPKIISEWDKARTEIGEDVDDDLDPLDKKIAKKVNGLYRGISEYYLPPEDEKGQRDEEQTKWFNEWKKDMKDTITKSLEGFAHCFFAENLLRRYIVDKSYDLDDKIHRKARKRQDEEKGKMEKEGIKVCFRKNIWKDCPELNYLDFTDFARIIEKQNPSTESDVESLKKKIDRYGLLRNAIAHTSVITSVALSELHETTKKIYRRVKEIIYS